MKTPGTNRGTRLFRIAVLTLFAGILCSFLIGEGLNAATLIQQSDITGRVTDAATGDPLAGVTVRLSDTDIRTVTDAEGYYSITVPAPTVGGVARAPQGVLVFTRIGYRSAAEEMAGRMTIDVSMDQSIAVLDEVVITGYMAQRRADITGAVGSVDVESVTRQSGSSVLKALDGRVAGVTVESSGSPGSRTTIRVRGISSFQNNDPLYIIDGTPTVGSYLNFLNPNDIESIQVLKDASAASIYGSRANNGVIIIETKKGSVGAPQVTVDVRAGVATPTRGYDDFLILDALEYHDIVRRAHVNAGLPVPENIYGDPNNPTVPAYIFPNDGVNQTTSADLNSYSFPDNLIMPGSAGTNWWDAVFGPGFVGDFNLNISGGSADSRYNVSFNYLNQDGTAAFNRFERGSARVNTEFGLGRITVGENFTVAIERSHGGLDDGGGSGEDTILGKNILMQPVIPVYDAGGNFASGKSVGLGNQSNPLKVAALELADDVVKNTRVLGNVFATFDVLEGLSFTTRLGFNLNDFSLAGFTPIYPEDSEPNFVNGINEENRRNTDWTWNNVLNYAGTFGSHGITGLLGHAATESNERFVTASLNNLLTTDINARFIQDAIGDPSTKNVSSTGTEASLVSVFGKINYNFADRYHLSFTLRRDGSSRLGPSNRWGTFPAIGAGWRLSEESFLAGSPLFTNLMLRFGWGITGSQNIPTGRIVSQFGGGRGDTFYAIGGGNTIAPGFRQVSLGNDSLKWEENQSINVGLDLELGGSLNLVVDVYQRNTDNLLFDPQVPATAGVADPPVLNIGEMRNRGIDFSIWYRGTIGDEFDWSVNFNGSHYKNEIVRIDGVSEFFFGYGGAAAPLRAGDRVVLWPDGGRVVHESGRSRCPCDTDWGGSRPDPVHGCRWRRRDHLGRPDGHRRSASGFHRRIGLRVSLERLGLQCDPVRFVRERHFRSPEELLRVPRFQHQRPARAAHRVRGGGERTGDQSGRQVSEIGSKRRVQS
jgi:TonB-linked SusC/RagA family outer membrane protein